MRNAIIATLTNVAIVTILSAGTAAAQNPPSPPALPLPVSPPSTPSAKSAAATAAVSAHSTAPAVPLDPASELKRIHDRDVAYRKHAQSDLKAWNDSRTQRAEAHRAEITRQWGSIAQKPEAQVEFKVHADRMARLLRALDVAEQLHDIALLAKIKELSEHEIIRDARVLDALKAKAGAP